MSKLQEKLSLREIAFRQCKKEPEDCIPDDFVSLMLDILIQDVNNDDLGFTSK